MSAPEMTDEMKNDMKLLRYRQVWDSTTKAKKSDRRGNAPFFQVGTIMDSAEVKIYLFLLKLYEYIKRRNWHFL